MTPLSSGLRTCDSIAGTPGFATGFQLSASELAAIRLAIRNHLADAIRSEASQLLERFLHTELEDYHTLADLLPHDRLVTRTQRILPQIAVDSLRSTSLFRQLEEHLGPFAISDEEGVGRESVSMRLVRPQIASDVGSLHTDDWFWKLYGFPVPSDVTRVKVWVAICCEPGKSGLLLSPDSHQRAWKYQVIERAGMKKPLLDETERPVLQLFESEPGDAVAFNYRMLHGGAVTSGDKTRVSVEFTLLVPAARQSRLNAAPDTTCGVCRAGRIRSA